MEISDFLFDYIVLDSFEGIDQSLKTKEDLLRYCGFDVPFTIEEVQEWNEDVEQFFNNYLEEHNFKVIESNIDYYNLEKSYIKRTVIFTFEDKYYKTHYIESSYISPLAYGKKKIYEVTPHEKTIIVYD